MQDSGSQADNFKTAGPLIPQWVINNGPVDSNLVSLLYSC
jgi:hypothetical protein